MNILQTEIDVWPIRIELLVIIVISLIIVNIKAICYWDACRRDKFQPFVSVLRSYCCVLLAEVINFGAIYSLQMAQTNFRFQSI